MLYFLIMHGLGTKSTAPKNQSLGDNRQSDTAHSHFARRDDDDGDDDDDDDDG